MDITRAQDWPDRTQWVPYYLEYLEPVGSQHHWAFATHKFAALSDEIARAQIVSFVATRGLEEGEVVRYPRLHCCINRQTGKQIQLPWQELHALVEESARDKLAA